VKKLILKFDNVSLRAFLFLLNFKNLKREISNITICDYIIDLHKDLFIKRYENLKSFRSGYTGIMSLLFDSNEAQDGKSNKYTKILGPILKNVILRLNRVKVNFNDNNCIIDNIPGEDFYKIVSIFFNVKPIDAQFNKLANLSHPKTGWIKLLAEQLNINEFSPYPALETDRGTTGTKAIL